MDDGMDYVYHHPEQHPAHGQLPYSQRPRCPYYNRTETYAHTGVPPHRLHYDPVHASANHWQSQAHLPPHPWQPAMLGRGTSPSYHRQAGSITEPPYFNFMPSLRTANASYQGPPHDINGLQTLHPPFQMPQPPSVQYGPIPTNPSGRNQPPMPAPERAFGQSTATHNRNHFGTFTPPVTSTPPAAVQDSPESSAESPPAPEPPASTQAPLASSNLQFGSAPPSSQHNSDSYRPTAGGEGLAVLPNYFPLHNLAHVTPSSFSAASTPPNNPFPAASSADRRRVAVNPLRRLPRRPSPPSDRDYDHEVEFRMLEHVMGSVGRDIDDNHIRNAQMMRGSVTTKMVASMSAIQSLRSVDISGLSESERTCVICYNDFGVETPEGVKEAPLRLPKCKHIFGDHCIKKWFEDSDSCPYCRDKVPSEPKMTSTNSHLASLLFRQRALRERDTNHGSDELGRAFISERRSPPTDGGDSRRRIRPRHGPVRGPGSPPFLATRPGSFGGSSTSHERRPHAFTSRTHTANAPTRGHSGGLPSLPFSTGNLTQYHTPSFGGPNDAASASSSVPMIAPPYVPTSMPHALSQAGQGSEVPNSTNRNSLPAPPPSNWQNGIPEDTRRRAMAGESSSVASGTSHWGAQ